MTELVEVLQKAAGLMDQMLKLLTGLNDRDRKLVAYYTLATHGLEHLHTFPLLVLLGPMGTGKSTTLHVITVFAKNPREFNLRGSTLSVIRDALAESNNGTAIIEEGDSAYKDPELFEQLLSGRYQRASAKVSLKVPTGDGGWRTEERECFGATALHRRIPFADAALEGRSIFIYFRPKHNKTYSQFYGADPMVGSARQLLQDIKLKLPLVTRSRFKGAGRIFESHEPLLALAQLIGDDLFIDQISSHFENETYRLKEAQSIEPDGLVVRALIECLSMLGGELRFHYVRVKELRASIWNNHLMELRPRQIAVIARELGFRTTNSRGYTVVDPTPATLLHACEQVGYEEDECVAALKKKIAQIEPGEKG